MSTALTPEMEALKSRLRSTWMAGDFDLIAHSYSPGAREFVERLGLQARERVLDVACGTGNLSFPSARAGASVTGADIAVNLLATARARAAEQGMSIEFLEGDAEHLPFAEASFDSVITMFGAMFAPRPDLVAQELLRVCKPGGRLAMANWTPTGFIGQMFKLTGSYVPPPALMPSPLLWGDEEKVSERLGAGTNLRFARRMITFTFPFSVGQVAEYWRTYYGPTQRAFEALPADRQEAFATDFERHWADHNQATDGTIRVESEYLEVLGERS